MVGQPKHLSDLARIEADVRITCRWCGYEDDWRREELADRLRAIGGSAVWSEITRHLRCRRFGCGSPDLRATALPYASRQANLPRRIRKLDEHLIATVMTVLERASSQRPGEPIATLEVRLALLVAYAYGRDREGVRLFWERCTPSGRPVHDTLAGALTRVRGSLERRGWLAPIALLDRPRVWPWNSPTPRGWLQAPGAEAHEPTSNESE